MAALFENMPNLTNYVRNVIPTKTTSITSMPNLLYILLGALLIIAIVLMLINKKIDWSFLDIRPKGMQVTQSAYVYWKPSPIYTNLKIPINSITNFESDMYSFNFDLLLHNTRVFNTTEGPWRHIVHRGSNELESTTFKGQIVSGCVPNVGHTLPPFGLPKRMNPGIFLDPNTNDIIVYVDSENGSESYRESVRIADIPMDIPCRIGVVIRKRILEVYINCKLEVTKVLAGDPKNVENVWYGLAGGAAAQAQIQNMYIWTKALNVNDMNSLCASLGKVSYEVKRPLCDASDNITTTASASATASASVAPLMQYGTALGRCPT